MAVNWKHFKEWESGMDIQIYFQAIRDGDIDHVKEQATRFPWLTDVVNPDRSAYEERQPLHCAAKHERLEIVKLLNELDAEIYPYAPYCYPPVIIAHR